MKPEPCSYTSLQAIHFALSKHSDDYSDKMIKEENRNNEKDIDNKHHEEVHIVNDKT